MSTESAETASSSESRERGVGETGRCHDFPRLNDEDIASDSAEDRAGSDARTISTDGEGRGDGDVFVRAHVHALQFVMDPDVLSRIVEDKEALRAVALQIQNGHGSNGHQYLDAETCQRVGRLVRLLTAYFERVRQDVCLGRLHAQAQAGDEAEARWTDPLEQFVVNILHDYPVEALEERVRLFESEAVHHCLSVLLPNLLGVMMQDVRRMPTGAMADLLVMWARLCGEFLSARLMQMVDVGHCFALRYEVREASGGIDGDESKHANDNSGGDLDNRENQREDGGGSGDGGRVYASHDAYVEQVRVAFDTLTDAVKLMDSMIKQMRAATPQLDGWDHGEHLKQMMFEMERLEPVRSTDWVDMDARQIPTDHGLWGRFHAAILVDVFGQMESVMEALRTGESLVACVALLKFVRAAMPVLAEEKQRVVVEEAVGAVCGKYGLAFDEGGVEETEDYKDADGRLGFDGFVNLVDGTTSGKAINVHAIVTSLLPALGAMADITASERASSGASEASTAIASAVASLERRMIWSLFSSKNVSEQLLSVTSLIEILEAVEEMGDSHAFEDGDDDLQRIRISWIQSTDILTEMLKVNLHHAQYVEDMLLLLGALAVHDLVDGRHVAQLWSTIQDQGTFEEIKSNVCQLLGFLATSLSATDDTELFYRNLQATCDAQSVEAKYVEEMMLAAASHDPSLRLMVRLIDITLGFCLNESAVRGATPNRTKRMLSGDLLLDIARKYLAHCRSSQSNAPVIDCMCSVISTCMGRITAGKEDGRGGVLEEPDAVELLPPLQLLLRIVSGVKIPSDILDDIYKVVNDGAKLISDIMAGYEQNLIRISQSDHASELLGVFNAILRSVLSESNYYVEFGKVRKVLAWAIAPDASAESSTYAWNLLTYLVQGEKGITSKTARLFLISFMEEVKILDIQSWMCLTAYVAACLDFESSLAVADSYVSLIVMTEDNRSDDMWGPLRGYLRECLLTCCETDDIAAQCSKLLSRMLITDMDMNPGVSNLQQVREIVESFKNRLMDNPDRVMMFLSDILEVYDYRECDDRPMRPIPVDDETAAQQAGVSVADAPEAPATNGPTSARPLYACYRDSEMSFKVVLKNLPMSPRPGGLGGQHVVDVSCPRNCMIADLRAIVSLQASHLVGYMIPPANFNLLVGGKSLASNISRVFEWVEDGGEVVAVFCTKVSLKVAPLPEFQLSLVLAQDEWFFGSLMALGDQGSRPALELITRLPISRGMVHTISHSCANEGQKAPEELGISFMLYMCRLMHSSITPMAVEGVPSCNVAPPHLHVPAWWLLLVMSQLYSEVGNSMGGEVLRTIIHLTRWIIDEDLRHDIIDGQSDQGKGANVPARRPDRAVALELLRDIVWNALKEGESSTMVSLDDVLFVASGVLRAILDLGQAGLKDLCLGPLIDNIKEALWHSDRRVREVGMQTVQALCREIDNVECVLLRELVSGVLLCESQPQFNLAGGHVPSSLPKEQLQLCSWFVDRMDSSLNGDMLNIAEIVCQRIMRCLGNQQSIDDCSRCLQIALLRVDATDLPSMKSLVSEILDTFLLGLATSDGPDSSSDPTSQSYFQSFRTRKYALDQHAALYRVLLSSALLSEECWQIAHAGLDRFFNSASFPSLYNNRALDSFRSLDGYCGLLNGGATCYMNATFQQLYMMPRLRRLLLTAPMEESQDKSSPVFETLRTIFLRLFAGVDEVVDPSCFWKEFKDYDGNPVDVREHQDGYEFFTRLQDAVDEYLHSLGYEKIMRSVLGGSFNQVIEVPDHEGVKSEREEEFYQISVDVRGKKDLIESLESYVAPETLDGQNQWFCESLGHKVDAKKRTLIKKLPESLVFHLKRFEWDYETYQRWKIKDRFEFPMMLDMGPYLDVSCDANGGCAGNANGGHIYELSGVIVHSGTAFAGHYYSFAKERATGRWFHFDDDSVTPWDVADIEQECFGGQFQPTRESKMYMRSQSAYIVMYDRQAPASRTNSARGMKPAHSLAWPDEFDDTCASVPASRLQEILEANQAEFVKSTAFSESLAKCMSTISKEVECAVQGPAARKAKVYLSPSLDVPMQIPLHNEVFYVSRGQDLGNLDFPLVINQAVVLGLEYISRIAVCGPLGRDPAVEVLQPLISVCQEPRTASYVLSQPSTVDSVLGAMASPYKASRTMLRSVMSACAKASIDSTECMSFLEKILDRIKSAMETPALLVTWRDLLGLLCDISQSIEGTRILANYTEILLSFSEIMFQLWMQQTKQERAADSMVLTSYAVLVCKLLRHHRLSNSDEESRDIQIGNPFCIARDRELGFELSSEAISHLVALGMDDDALLLFLQFLSWESSVRSTTCVEAIMENIRTSQHERQVPLTVQWLRMDDSTSTARQRTFLRSALGLFDELDGNGWIAYNISIAIASVLSTCPSVASSACSAETRDIDLTPWARKQSETCLTIAQRLGGDGQYREQWIQGIPSSADDALRVLYDPSQLLVAIKALLGENDFENIVNIVEEDYEIDLVKASSDEDKENDGDEVKDIELD
jgi:ubiquitin C-terminal hydrolase